MTLSSFEKNQLRFLILLELNACFVTVSKHYAEHGTEEHREFLQTLIDAIRESVAGKSDVKLAPSS